MTNYRLEYFAWSHGISRRPYFIEIIWLRTSSDFETPRWRRKYRNAITGQCGMRITNGFHFTHFEQHYSHNAVIAGIDICMWSIQLSNIRLQEDIFMYGFKKKRKEIFIVRSLSHTYLSYIITSIWLLNIFMNYIRYIFNIILKILKCKNMVYIHAHNLYIAISQYTQIIYSAKREKEMFRVLSCIISKSNSVSFWMRSSGNMRMHLMIKRCSQTASAFCHFSWIL